MNRQPEKSKRIAAAQAKATTGRARVFKDKKKYDRRVKNPGDKDLGVYLLSLSPGRPKNLENWS